MLHELRSGTPAVALGLVNHQVGAGLAPDARLGGRRPAAGEMVAGTASFSGFVVGRDEIRTCLQGRSRSAT